MAVVFLSDVHLSENTPAITDAFYEIVDFFTINPPEAIFILGDLFNIWLGDNISFDFADKVAAKLFTLSKKSPLFFQRGNRDFLLASDFLAKSGMTLLPERFMMTLEGKRILLEHGDLLCTDDLGYQRLRRILHAPWFYKLSSLTPSWLNYWVANYLRKQSQKRTAMKASNIIDVNQEVVIEAIKAFQADILIHGHTHRPQIHALADNKTRIVLGDWRPEGEILCLEKGQFFFDFFKNLHYLFTENRKIH